MAARGASYAMSRRIEDDEEEEDNKTVCGICAHFASAQLTPARIMAAVALFICVREIYICTK